MRGSPAATFTKRKLAMAIMMMKAVVLFAMFFAQAAAFSPSSSYLCRPISSGAISQSCRTRAANSWAASRRAVQTIRMGGGNVPRVPYKAPGEDSYQFIDIWNRLYRERILYIGQDLDDEFANQMIAVLLFLQREDSTSLVQLYFNCPGGEVRAGLALYDTMKSMGFPVSTLNLGIAASISGFLCGAGDKGKRLALPNARFLLQTPKLEDMGLSQVLYGQASDVKIEANEIIRQREKIFRGLCEFTGKTYETIRKDLNRDLYLTSTEAVDYGLIDKVLLPLQRTASDIKKIEMQAQQSRNFGRI